MKIILDTDPGVDDAMALLLALRSPELDVVGVTTVFGNSNVAATTRNALNLLDLAHRRDIPVAKGAARPLFIEPHPTAEWVHGDDAMGNIGWTAVNDPRMATVRESAAQFIVNTVLANPGEVTLVPVGPLTNIALALQLEPAIAAHTRVVLMGGTVRHPGNVSPVAEANVWNDPHAAHVVFSAEWDVTMAGLDVTETVHLDNADFAELRASGDPLGVFVTRIAGFYQDFSAKWYGYANGEVDMHDPTAVMYLIAPELFAVERYPIAVPTEGLAAGATIADRRVKFFRTPRVTCLMGVDAARYVSLYKQRLTSGA